MADEVTSVDDVVLSERDELVIINKNRFLVVGSNRRLQLVECVRSVINGKVGKNGHAGQSLFVRCVHHPAQLG